MALASPLPSNPPFSSISAFNSASFAFKTSITLLSSTNRTTSRTNFANPVSTPRFLNRLHAVRFAAPICRFCPPSLIPLCSFCHLALAAFHCFNPQCVTGPSSTPIFNSCFRKPYYLTHPICPSCAGPRPSPYHE